MSPTSLKGFQELLPSCSAVRGKEGATLDWQNDDDDDDGRRRKLALPTMEQQNRKSLRNIVIFPVFLSMLCAQFFYCNRVACLCLVLVSNSLPWIRRKQDHCEAKDETRIVGWVRSKKNHQKLRIEVRWTVGQSVRCRLRNVRGCSAKPVYNDRIWWRNDDKDILNVMVTVEERRFYKDICMVQYGTIRQHDVMKRM